MSLTTLVDTTFQGQPLITARNPFKAPDVDLTSGLRVASADDHLIENSQSASPWSTM